ncbi:DUF1565 domain-containing protein [uncultured Massilia sp.]|uniref:DUF1565 domain-containing protein n=1 Tax=uncultured Massilia sp. TaxID=169973 RepID=UPI0025F863A2|nr:DUF1565 domain-containing protein [uncultured Massilia sp.]
MFLSLIFLPAIAGCARWRAALGALRTPRALPALRALRPPGVLAALAALAVRASLAAVAAVLPLAACTVKDKPPVSVTPQVVPTELWVAPDGLDSNPGTRAAPLRTLARAARVVRPGTIVNVLPGTYHGGFRTAVSGLPNARIVFRATQRRGARIVPPPVSSSAMAWENRASYVDIEGFEVDGSAHGPDAAAGIGTRWTIGIYNAGSYDRIVDNHVHHVATAIPCTSAGGSGIGIDSFFRGRHAQVLGNSVHDIGPPGCRWVQGIYVNTPAVVRGNVVYRIAAAGIHLWHDAREVVVVNNTVVASTTGIVVGGGDFYHASGPNDHTRVLNNIVFDNRYGILEQGQTGKHNSYRNNLVFGNREDDWRLAPGMTHSGTVAAPPGFVGYTREGTPDLRLAATSPAIGRGLAGKETGVADGAPDGAAGDAGAVGGATVAASRGEHAGVGAVASSGATRVAAAAAGAAAPAGTPAGTPTGTPAGPCATAPGRAGRVDIGACQR